MEVDEGNIEAFASVPEACLWRIHEPGRGYCELQDRVGGGLTAAVLSHHRTYGSVYGGSCLLTNNVSEFGSVDVSPVVSKRPDRPSELPAPTS
ncbi:hypothetical protein MF6394_02300 [Pseudomonas sp. MF6394]|nr:hypothetical protein MF6394_02300 [Pseudomonas sp. MF6394]